MKLIMLVLMLCCAFLAQQVDGYNKTAEEIEVETGYAIFLGNITNGENIDNAYKTHEKNMKEITSYITYLEEQEESKARMRRMEETVMDN